MATIYCSFGALTIANLYYFWRGYHGSQLHKERQLRERVTYMLWVMAKGVQ